MSTMPMLLIDDVLRPFSDDVRYEVIDGQAVEVPPMSAFDSILANVIYRLLSDHVLPRALGHVVNEVMFRLRATPVQERRPDVAFVSAQRWPLRRRVPRRAAWHVVPELAVEVVSPGNYADEMVLKVRDYFQAGVQLVWIVYPAVEQVYVYDAPTRVRILTRDEILDGGAVLPEFRLPLATLFEHETEEDEGTASD